MPLFPQIIPRPAGSNSRIVLYPSAAPELSKVIKKVRNVEEGQWPMRKDHSCESHF